MNETLIPISTLEDEDFSYIPTVIEPDILEYHIDIHESSTGFTSTIKDHYLSTIQTYSHSAQTLNIPKIKRNMVYHITYHGSKELKLKKGNDVLHAFNSNNSTYSWTLNQATPLGSTTFKATIENNSPSEIPIEIEENKVFEFGMRNKPSWITINKDTGELTGTPTQSDVGVFRTIYLTVTSNINTVEHVQTAPFSFSVVNKNDKPISQNLPQSATLVVDEGGSIDFDLIANDEDNDPINYIISNTKGPKFGKAYTIGKTLYYTHFGNESIEETFEYFVNDGTENSTVSTITIQITPVNDQPTLEPENKIMGFSDTISIALSGEDADNDKTTLTYEIVTPVDGASINGSTLTYTPPQSLPRTTEKIEINVVAIDPSNLKSKPAVFNIYFYHTNKHPSKLLEISDIEFEIGEHYTINDIIWDLKNEITNNDRIKSESITYSMNPNSFFSINPNTGELKVNSELEYKTTGGNSQTLQIKAHSDVDNELVGVTATAIITVGKSMDISDNNNNNIPDDIENIDSGDLIIDRELDFTKIGDLNKKDVNFVIDTGEDFDIESADVSMNSLTVGGRKKSTIKLKEEGNLNIITDLILGKQNDYQAEIQMNDDVTLTIGNDFTIGDFGSATLSMSDGETDINGDLKAGLNTGSMGSIKISGKANLSVKNNFIVGEKERLK